MSLKDYGDQDMRNELARRKKDREIVEFDRQRAKAEFTLQHIDAMLELVPEHDRAGCADDSDCGHNGLCMRCTLLRAKADEFLNSDYEVVLTLKNHAR